MASITLSAVLSGGTVGGLTKILTQDATVTAGNTDIPISVNGGILPINDSGVRLASTTGPLFQGAGMGKYTINRGVTPNLLVLNTAPLADLDFLIQLIYP